MKKCSKLINSLEQMYIIIGFAFFSLFAPVLVIDYLMSFSSLAFSILPLQKLAPRCANPHFKAPCLSAGNKAHRTYYGSLLFPHIYVNIIAFFCQWQHRDMVYFYPKGPVPQTLVAQAQQNK